MSSRTAQKCICCDSEQLKQMPAVLLPFISHRVFDWAPVEIDDSWDLGRYGIKNGMAYSLCNSLQCVQCDHLFLDIRFNDEEMSKLYDGYREEEYIKLRDLYEDGYRQRNQKLNLGYNYVRDIEAFLLPHVGRANGLAILDWGGDTGKNTPFHNKNNKLHIYDISDRPVIGEAQKVDKVAAQSSQYDLVVCSNVLEHVPYPSSVLKEIREAMSTDTILYIELPYENLVRRAEERSSLGDLYTTKRHWHEHINFFNARSIEKILYKMNFEILELETLRISGEIADYVYEVACRVQ